MRYNQSSFLAENVVFPKHRAYGPSEVCTLLNPRTLGTFPRTFQQQATGLNREDSEYDNQNHVINVHTTKRF